MYILFERFPSLILEKIKNGYILFSMESSSHTWGYAAIGSVLGGFIPELWGAGMFSFSSLLFSTLGALAGIYVAFKTRY